MVPSRGVRIAIIVSTIGRPGPLRRLVRSLELSRPSGEIELIVVDQSDDTSCLGMLEREPPNFPVLGLTSPRGASRGRNAGAAVARGDILAFPDDNCWYDPRTLASVMTAFDGPLRPDGVTGRQLTANGEPSMLRWHGSERWVTPLNINRTAIESTLFLRRNLFESVGGFDPDLGVGSAGPYQAGECSDLLLRALERGARVRYAPEIIVRQDDPRHHPPEGFGARMRGYGRGFGLVHRRHHLPVWQFSYMLARKYAAVAVRGVLGARARAEADLAWANGAIEGYRAGGPR